MRGENLSNYKFVKLDSSNVKILKSDKSHIINVEDFDHDDLDNDEWRYFKTTELNKVVRLKPVSQQSIGLEIPIYDNPDTGFSNSNLFNFCKAFDCYIRDW